MRLLLVTSLGLVLSACGSSRPYGPVVERLPRRPPPTVAASPPVVDPVGRTSHLSPSRDVVVDGVSIVGRWTAEEVLNDDRATADLQSGALSKTLVVNPSGRATLRGRDGPGPPVTFVGDVEGSTLRLADLPGAATLWLRGDRLHVLDPSGATTIYTWDGR